MKIGPFIITTQTALRDYVDDLSMALHAPNEVVASLHLYVRLLTGRTTLAHLRAIEQELFEAKSLQEDAKDVSDS